MILDLLGVEVTGEHARLIMAVLGGLVGAVGFLAGRWSKHRSHVRFRHEDLVASSVVIELYGIACLPDGTEQLDVVAQGGSQTLEAFFPNPELAARVRRQAQRHPGLMQLADPVAHRMMMDEGRDKLMGLDPGANLDFIAGRPTREDEVLLAFGAYREREHDSNGLHDQVARLVLMAMSPDLVGRLADPDYVRRLAVRHSGYGPRRDRLHELAREWQRLEALPRTERSAGTDRVWRIALHRSLA